LEVGIGGRGLLDSTIFGWIIKILRAWLRIGGGIVTLMDGWVM